MKIAAAYIRVSTEEQTELSPDSQVKLIREYAKKNGYVLPDEYIFHDDGISGRTTAKRPGFNKMIGTAKTKPKPFDAILLWKFSRFARNREDSIVYKSMLRKLGIDVISISENVGDDKMSVLIEAMIEAMDEYYSINLAEEVRRGMLEKVSRGEIVSAPPIGYTLNDGNFIPDENAPLIRKIFNLFVSGKTYVGITRQLNAEGYRTVKGNTFESRNVEYILRNPTYIGKLRWTPDGRGSQSHYHNNKNKTIVIDSKHEPIISKELWDTAQERIEQIKKQHTKYAREEKVVHEYMLRGIVRCSNCGSTLTLSFKNGGLQCHLYSKGKCNESHFISLNKLNESVLTAFEELTQRGNLNIEYRSQTPKTESDSELLIKKEKEKLKRIKEAYLNGIDTIEEYKTNKAAITKRIEEIEASANPPKIVMSKSDATKDLRLKMSEFLTLARDPESDQSMLNKFLKEFVSKIVFNRANCSVEIFFYI